MKRVVVVLLLIIMLLGMTACGSVEQSTYAETIIENSGFCPIEHFGTSDGIDIFLVYDPDTGVEYLFANGFYRLSISPYYNSDGTVAIYNGK